MEPANPTLTAWCSERITRFLSGRGAITYQDGDITAYLPAVQGVRVYYPLLVSLGTGFVLFRTARLHPRYAGTDPFLLFGASFATGGAAQYYMQWMQSVASRRHPIHAEINITGQVNFTNNPLRQLNRAASELRDFMQSMHEIEANAAEQLPRIQSNLEPELDRIEPFDTYTPTDSPEVIDLHNAISPVSSPNAVEELNDANIPTNSPEEINSPSAAEELSNISAQTHNMDSQPPQLENLEYASHGLFSFDDVLNWFDVSYLLSLMNSLKNNVVEYLSQGSVYIISEIQELKDILGQVEAVAADMAEVTGIIHGMEFSIVLAGIVFILLQLTGIFKDTQTPEASKDLNFLNTTYAIL